MRAVREEAGRLISWTWRLDGRNIDETSSEDCRLITNWLRRRTKKLGGLAVRAESGIDDPESLLESVGFFDHSNRVLITAQPSE